MNDHEAGANRRGSSAFRGTKGRIIVLLRGPGLTVAELAAALGLTGNAVRGHLAALERDRMVESRGARRVGAKPSVIYGATPAAQALFPKAHGAVIGAMIEELRQSRTPAELTAFIASVGKRLAGARAKSGGTPSERMEAAAVALEGLGGVAQVEETADGFAVFCHDCPLADVAADHAEMCAIANAVLSEIAETQLSTRCSRGARPACRFETSKDVSRLQEPAGP